MRLKDKVALVTGAGQGMGRAIARRFAAEGATVVALDVNLEAAQETLAGLGGKSIARKVNIASSADVAALVAEVMDSLGSVDVLVNNAGVGSVTLLPTFPMRPGSASLA
jgi:3-oxoacyl-[acyl-carrier protein] reductase